MTEQEFKERTKQIALRVIRLVESLPNDADSAQIIGKQLLRSATSVGANYRAACRGKSVADVINKLEQLSKKKLTKAFIGLNLLIESEIMTEQKTIRVTKRKHQRNCRNDSFFNQNITRQKRG